MADWFLKIGNSRIVCWNGAKKFCSFKSDAPGLRQCLRVIKSTDRLWFFSVHPDLSVKLNQATKFKKILVREITLPDLPLRPAYKKNIGIDRLMNIFEASFLTKQNLVVVDVGTALTVDFFSRTKGHLGGWISIGPHLTARALHQFTSKLPLVTPRSIHGLFGKSTEESLLLGQKAFLRGMILEVTRVGKKQFGPGFKIFLTGGGAHWMPKTFEKRVEHLGLRGLKRLIQS